MNKGIFDTVTESMYREQKDFRRRIDNTKDEMMSDEPRKRRSKIMHIITKRSMENASSFMDERANEIEGFHDGPQMFKTSLATMSTTLSAEGARRVETLHWGQTQTFVISSEIRQIPIPRWSLTRHPRV